MDSIMDSITKYSYLEVCFQTGKSNNRKFKFFTGHVEDVISYTRNSVEIRAHFQDDNSTHILIIKPENQNKQMVWTNDNEVGWKTIETIDNKKSKKIENILNTEHNLYMFVKNVVEKQVEKEIYDLNEQITKLNDKIEKLENNSATNHEQINVANYNEKRQNLMKTYGVFTKRNQKISGAREGTLLCLNYESNN